ncbi:NADH-quinone oxidoreductase subunit NuoK [Caldinitratiruptor microaerophilus]|uniref:NADH-quinone oxidoreductase subunit K n=1 Tax=Caldinitratiruptor microaerophilus TaxID=671077 RepID=A0AA35CP19_9FIRM|nr:NADH-quinone oxidoreductase subunit NuoK [Caldinitratiruptor microaerophilus]BDG61227.1 NAD(P)H-quinone oxidoreductase subunit 4L [Caldinitratiruptor microaerophilus]
MALPIYLPLGLGAFLFGLGLWGALTRTNAVRILMFIEIMLNGVNLNLVTFTRYYYPDQPAGPILTLFVMTVAAAEASIGLAIILQLVRSRGTVDVDKVDLLKG